MSQESLCPLCKSRHHPRQAHRFATNKGPAATNMASATNRRPHCATNNEGVRKAAAGGGTVTHEARAAVVNKDGKTANRRSKEAFRAYQRDYMRRRRGG